MNHVIKEIARSLVMKQEPDELLDGYRKALESHDTPMIVLSTDGTICYLNQAACSLAKVRSSREVVGKHVDNANFAWFSDGTSAFDRLAQGENTMFFVLDHNSYVCECIQLYDRLGMEVGVLECIHSDVVASPTEGVDELTGLYERRRFCTETRRLIDINADTKYAIVYWDIIRFNVINDVFSKSTGDMVLKNIAESIRSFVGDKGTCGRIVSDHFVFCVPEDMLDPEWFKRNSEVTLMSDTALYTFNSRYGVYIVDDRSCSVDSMCEWAGVAKSTVVNVRTTGDPCVAYYTEELRQRTEEDQDLTSQLSYAIETDQIKVYFQPIYDIETGQVASAEALVRWEHPERGVISPGRFIPLFEGNGMITGLDKHLWDKVGAFLSKRLAEGKHVVPVSVNVSRVDFFALTLIDDLQEIVTTHNLPSELFRVEVTESAYAADPDRILEVVDRLRESGFTVLIDDFGSGYSSLNMLKEISLDILKLDMRFLHNFHESFQSRCIIQHIVAMAKDLGLKIVAEGVETEEQADFLKSVGCNLAQGFLYARPQPESDFARLLDEVDSQTA